MKEGKEYSEACSLAGYRHSARSLTKVEIDNKNYVDNIENIKAGSLRNPVVEKILNQMINVVNQLVECYGKPDEIRIELARELKKSAADRAEMTAAISKATKSNNDIAGKLIREFNIPNPSRNDIIRYRLYEELASNGYKTLYSSTYITPNELFGPKFNVEHIVPQSRLFDDSFTNKTLEATDINIEKGNDTAIDYVVKKYGSEGADSYRARVEKLFKDKKISKGKRDRLLMTGKEIPSDFINRDLCDTQYISRKAREILEELVPVVTATTGSVTDRLREDWQLVNVMQELNWEKYDRLGLTESYVDRHGQTVRRIKDWTKRNDHRHHAMDAIAIAFSRPQFIQYLNNLNARSDKSGSIYAIERRYLYRDNHNNLRFIPPMPLDILRSAVKSVLERIIVSHKAKNKVVTRNINVIRRGNEKLSRVQLTPRGKLHDETVHGAISRYETSEERVNTSFTTEKIARVAVMSHREALLARLAEYGGDPKKAFSGKNSLDKNPVYIDASHSAKVPSRVKLVELKTYYTVRKPVDSNLNIDKVVDARIKRLLQQRLDEFDGKADKAFSNLDENPIYLDEAKTIPIKRVKVFGRTGVESIHRKHDHLGDVIVDGNHSVPADFVSPNSNHHAAIFRDNEGNLQEVVVPFLIAVARATVGLPVIDRNHNKSEGWNLLFTIKRNEIFVFPRYEKRIDDSGNEIEVKTFDPKTIDLKDPDNLRLISPNLYRVQKLASKNYYFRHHLETNVDDNNVLKNYSWKCISAIKNLGDIVKVRIDHLGHIIDVGEY